MKRILTAAALSITGISTATAADLVTKSSAYSVEETVDRLVAAVEKAGATVFARVDHAAGASSVGQELRPNQLVMFGNPKLGTPAMQASQTMGLDLPLRVVAWEDADGAVWVTYYDPADLAAQHGVPADAPMIGKMQGALDKLTGAATAK
ncbi:DUF302 domain-containing protein [Rhodobacteraceae bacterium NNCM2]|nr:DUF302 domain-containing protein [Coraliihabitans acroporae]